MQGRDLYDSYNESYIKDYVRKSREIFSINNFYNLGKNTIKSVLYRLNEENQITRLIDGLYIKAKYSEI